MPYQSYDPKTGKQITYKGETPSSGVAKVEYVDDPTTKPSSPNASKPTQNQEYTASNLYENDQGQTIDPQKYTNLKGDEAKEWAQSQGFKPQSQTEPEAEQAMEEGAEAKETLMTRDREKAERLPGYEYAGAEEFEEETGVPQNQQTQQGPEQPPQPGQQQGQQQPGQQEKAKEEIKPAINATAQQEQEIQNLVESGREFSKQDAKNFAYYRGENNWQKYVGGTGGEPNPNYIGPTEFNDLQKRYTSYQIEEATERTKDGIYWNPDVNIDDLPPKDPVEMVNEDADTITNVVDEAKSEADKTLADEEKDKGDQERDSDFPELFGDEKNEDIMQQLQNLYGTTAEEMYNDLFNTEEIQNLETKVNEKKKKMDEYDQQMENLKRDIRKEVEGEASESYISALASVRGRKILKQKRDAQRDLNFYGSQLQNQKQQASEILDVKMQDQNNRYNRMFSMLQLQLQEQGQQFDRQMALANMGMNLPQGRSIQLPDGTEIQGLKENDDLNTLQLTEANGDTYVVGFNKKTGEQKYKSYIGRTAVSGGGTSKEDTWQFKLGELQAKQQFQKTQEIQNKMQEGKIKTDVDDEGKTFYYDAEALQKAKDNAKWWWNDKVSPEEHMLFYAE